MNDFDIGVREVIKEVGISALYMKSTGEYDPSIGEIVEAVKYYPVQVAVFDRTLQSNGLSSKPGTEIVAGDKMMFMIPPNKVDEGLPPIVIEPTKDRVRIGDLTYQIVTMKEYSVAGDVVCYEFFIRR
jgi:hypothetical protein